jgi:hypothetical protein
LKQLNGNVETDDLARRATFNEHSLAGMAHVKGAFGEIVVLYDVRSEAEGK